MEEDIREMLKTRGWQYVEKFLEEEVEASIKGIKTDMSSDVIAIQYIGKTEAKAIIKKVLAKVKRIGASETQKAISYK